MYFNSLPFLGFFAIIWLLYIWLGKKSQNVLLLLASYFFYACWDWRFLSLIFFSTVVDYFCGIYMEKSEKQTQRRQLLIISLTVNLGALFFFKYFGFFVESFAALLETIGFSANIQTLEIILPVGISFYTFQTLSYTIDIYRKDMKPTRNFLNFALFVSYFPQLVAGPIERAKRLLPQIEQQRTVSMTQIREGAWLILVGFFKKVVIADNLAQLSAPVFSAPQEAMGTSVLIGLLAFTFQIYFDFSGYSDIARGVSKWFGIELMKNFKLPYFSKSPSEFWRRWHISLSTWIRDYLYISFGGNRGTELATYRNLMGSMLLGGLWHGASWHFVAWGVYHGFLLAVYKAFERFDFVIWRPLHGPFFFLLTMFGWALFAVQSLSDIPVLSSNLFVAHWDPAFFTLGLIALIGSPLVYFEFREERTGDEFIPRDMSWFFRYTIYCYLFTMILYKGVMHANEFIYFQF